MSTDFEVLSVDLNDKETRVSIKYTTPYGPGSYIQISPESYVKTAVSDVKFKLLHAENIPLSPLRHEFRDEFQSLFFTLIFPALPSGCKQFDIIEDEEDLNGINIYDIPVEFTSKSLMGDRSKILSEIENLALVFRSTPEIKNFNKEILNNTDLLSKVSNFLGLNDKDTAVFSLCLYVSVTEENFGISDIKRFTNFSLFDYLEIKEIIRSLEKKSWLSKVGGSRGSRSSREKYYCIPPAILLMLCKNEAPQIKSVSVDVYSISENLDNYFRDHYNDFMETDELLAMLTDMEEDYSDLQPFSLATELNLSINEKLLLYFLMAKVSSGEELVDVERMCSHVFGRNFRKMEGKKMMSQRKSLLFDLKYIEFSNDEFKTDRYIKLTKSGLEKLFGPDAFLFTKKEEFSSGNCKLISFESIAEKKLVYSDTELDSILSLEKFLQSDQYSEIVKRMEENQMRSGLNILLFGHPGTGKTETVYQLARKTKRNILLVDVSEIRDKWVGESEKKLKSVFEIYRNSFKHFDHIPILLFNESDALIGKRINVNSSVDQMNNAMQNILLQEMEDFKGILIATTNLTSNLDQAFERRFLFKVNFFKPGVEARKFIWQSKLEYLSDENVHVLAEEYDFSGGQIENISRKVFLDKLLNGAEPDLSRIKKFCDEELLSNKRGKKKIGF